MERCLGLVTKWLKKELSDKELFDCVKVREVLGKCEQELNETGNEFADKLERCYKLVEANSEKAYIPKATRACMVIRRVRITDTQRMFITQKMNSN